MGVRAGQTGHNAPFTSSTPRTALPVPVIDGLAGTWVSAPLASCVAIEEWPHD